MATPTIDNLLLPNRRILVLPDEGDKATTGVIFRRSQEGGGNFIGQVNDMTHPVQANHVLFVREMAVEVQVNSIEYLAMHERAVVALIPD